MRCGAWPVYASGTGISNSVRNRARSTTTASLNQPGRRTCGARGIWRVAGVPATAGVLQGSPGDRDQGGAPLFTVGLVPTIEVMVIQRTGIILVQGIVQLQGQLDFRAGLPAGAQMQQAVTSDFPLMFRGVVTAADGLPTGAERDGVEATIQVQAQGALGSPGEPLSAVPVARVNQAQAQCAMPAEQFLLQGSLEAVDPGGEEVLRDVVAVQDDGVFEVGAIQRRFQTGLLGQLAAPLQFVGLGLFQHQVRIGGRGTAIRRAIVRVVQVGKGGRTKAFGVGQHQVVGVVEEEGCGAIEGVFTAEQAVLVVAQAELGAQPLALEAVLQQAGMVPALISLVGGRGMQAFLVPVGTEQQAMSFGQRQGVQPGGRIAVGVERVGLGNVVETLDAAVLAVT